MDEGYDDEEENFEIIEEIELDDEEPNAGILCWLDHIIHMAIHVFTDFLLAMVIISRRMKINCWNQQRDSVL